MGIKKNNVVLLSYVLETEGAVADRATADRPLEYIHGLHMLLPCFERELEGLEAGASFDFTLQPEEAYGPYDKAKCKPLPKAAFTVNGELREDLMVPGRIIPLINGYGEVVQATVAEVRDADVLMDFNHPMAGKVLHFTGTILSVRDATEKELAEGLHGEFLPPEERPHCCHGKGRCHHGEGEKGHCHHGEGKHGEGECCHGDGEKDHCCHHEGENDGHCCRKD